VSEKEANVSKPFRSDKRKKELLRLKKQEEKRQRRFGLKQDSAEGTEVEGTEVEGTEVEGTDSETAQAETIQAAGTLPERDNPSEKKTEQEK
jgi:hypothetical protein